MSHIILIISPLIVVGITIVILTNNLNKTTEKYNQNEDNTQTNYILEGMSLGISFGVTIGSIFINSFGINAISYGICMGMLSGILIGKYIKKSNV